MELRSLASDFETSASAAASPSAVTGPGARSLTPQHRLSVSYGRAA
jgi:hypothetical protein